MKPRKNLKSEKKVPRKKKEAPILPRLDPDQIDLFADWYEKHHGKVSEFREQSIDFRYKKLQQFVRSLKWKERQYKLF